MVYDPNLDPKIDYIRSRGEELTRSVQQNPAGNAQTAATPAAATVTNVDAVTRDVQDNEKASFQLGQILDNNSPLMQRARTQGLQTAAQRGLLNSSMAAGESMNAMIDRATPLAQSDAGAFTQAAMDNMAARNNAAIINAQEANSTSRFNVGETNETNRFNVGQQNQFELQKLQNVFDSSQNTLGYETQAMLQSAGFEQDKYMQEDSQAFQQVMQSAEFAQQKLMQGEQLSFQETQNLLDRNLQVLLQQTDQSWRTGENAADRALQKYLQGEQLSFEETQAVLDRQLQLTMQENEFKYTSILQEDSQQFQALENEANRALEKLMQGERLAHDEAMAVLDRALQERLQDDDQSWRTSENDLDRTLQKYLQGEEISYNETQNALNRDLQERLQEDEQTFRSEENVLDRKARADEVSGERDFQRWLTENNQEFQAAQNELDRAMETGRIDASRRASLEATYISGVSAILADPNLTPESKEVAIANLKNNILDASTLFDEIEGINNGTNDQPVGQPTVDSPAVEPSDDSPLIGNPDLGLIGGNAGMIGTSDMVFGSDGNVYTSGSQLPLGVQSVPEEEFYALNNQGFVNEGLLNF